MHALQTGQTVLANHFLCPSTPASFGNGEIPKMLNSGSEALDRTFERSLHAQQLSGSSANTYQGHTVCTLRDLAARGGTRCAPADVATRSCDDLQR
jgi:hypothetical protein